MGGVTGGYGCTRLGCSIACNGVNEANICIYQIND